jgi:hypothetical protein
MGLGSDGLSDYVPRRSFAEPDEQENLYLLFNHGWRSENRINEFSSWQSPFPGPRFWTNRRTTALCKLLESQGMRRFFRLVRPAPLTLIAQVGQNERPSRTDAAQRKLFSLGTLLWRKVLRLGNWKAPGARLDSGTRITSRTHCAAAVLPVIVKDEAVRRE